MAVSEVIYKNLAKEKEESYQSIMSEIEAVVGERPELPEDLSRGNWSEQAVKVLEERYLWRDDDGKIIETPNELVWRVAWAIASAEARWGRERKGVILQARKFYELMASLKFLPNSPTLMNAGKDNGLQYSACFVLPVDDSLEGIFDAIKYQAKIHQSGGGTGFSFSRLRPKGSMVKASRGVASGPVSFMKVFNEATQQIKQGGTRRGANMGILRVDHPDIREFITCKLDGGMSNFNISVAATDEFMRALEKDKKYDLIDPRTGKVAGQEKARDIFDLICDCAWKSGDPGMMFIDKMNEGSANPVPSLGPVESTNPCGEQPLYPFDVCNLGSLFLQNFVVETKDGFELDWEGLKRAVAESVRFLDDVIEVNPFPLEEIWKVARSIRRIGLGIGGFADLLYYLRVPYDSDEAVELAEKIMTLITEEGHKASQDLAKERGEFPLWKESIYKDREPIRNATVTTIAPTGSIGILADGSGGIEPVFALAYKHQVKDESLNRELFFTDPAFRRVAKKNGFWSPGLASKVAETGSVAGLAEVPEKWQRVFVTSHEIEPSWHVKMQASWQKKTDNAVSKTINLPNGATVDEVAKAYLLSYKLGCLGITVYRDGSKEWQVLNVGTKGEVEISGITEEEVGEEKMAGMAAEMRIRPKKLAGSTYEVKTPVGTAFVTINADELGNPFEVFINIGRAGSHVLADAEAIGRLISLSLRVPSMLPAITVAETIVDQLSGIGGTESVGFGNGRVRSLADGVAKVLREYLANVFANGPTKESPLMEKNKVEEGGQQEALPLLAKRRDLCPECGQPTLVLEEGCSKCYSCGASKC